VGIVWKYIDIYNHYAIEFDFNTLDTIQFVWMYNNTPIISNIKKMNYSVNVWYQMVLVSRWNKVEVYFVTEKDD